MRIGYIVYFMVFIFVITLLSTIIGSFENFVLYGNTRTYQQLLLTTHMQNNLTKLHNTLQLKLAISVSLLLAKHKLSTNWIAQATLNDDTIIINT